MIFPRDFEGELNLLFVPFLQEQQSVVNTWIPFAEELESSTSGVVYYELPTIQSMPMVSRTFINEGMRAEGIGPRGQPSKTRISDAIVRRPRVGNPARADKPSPLEPVLGDALYEQVLGEIRNAAEQMERTPRTYLKLNEEERRDVMLTRLDGGYDSVSGEAFNRAGRTDILVQEDGRNIFIAECKFWSGAAGFTQTIDQLFGYSTWRDTKLAVVMFVKQKGLTSIIATARATLAAHGQFVAWKDPAGESELRAVMRWPGDYERHAELNVLFVHTPAKG